MFLHQSSHSPPTGINTIPPGYSWKKDKMCKEYIKDCIANLIILDMNYYDTQSTYGYYNDSYYVDNHKMVDHDHYNPINMTTFFYSVCICFMILSMYMNARSPNNDNDTSPESYQLEGTATDYDSYESDEDDSTPLRTETLEVVHAPDPHVIDVKVDLPPEYESLSSWGM